MLDKKIYITSEGMKNLNEEINVLERRRKEKFATAFPRNVLKANSSDGEVLSFWEEVGFMDMRAQEIKDIINSAEVIKPPSGKERKIIGIGATVVVETDGEKKEFTIVGSPEANPLIGKISNESVVGKSLLGHQPGDEVVVSSTKEVYRIKKVKY